MFWKKNRAEHCSRVVGELTGNTISERNTQSPTTTADTASSSGRPTRTHTVKLIFTRTYTSYCTPDSENREDFDRAGHGDIGHAPEDHSRGGEEKKKINDTNATLNRTRAHGRRRQVHVYIIRRYFHAHTELAADCLRTGRVGLRRHRNPVVAAAASGVPPFRTCFSEPLRREISLPCHGSCCPTHSATLLSLGRTTFVVRGTRLR